MRTLVIIIVLALVIMIARRLLARPQTPVKRKSASEHMVQCANCGIYIPEQEALQRGLPIEEDEVAFIGDSGNDDAMFEQFSNSFGVANIARFLDSLPQPPRFITSANGGFGFVELAERLLAAPIRTS